MVNEGQRGSTKDNKVTGFDGDNGDRESKQIEEGWRVDGQRGLIVGKQMHDLSQRESTKVSGANENGKSIKTKTLKS